MHRWLKKAQRLAAQLGHLWAFPFEVLYWRGSSLSFWEGWSRGERRKKGMKKRSGVSCQQRWKPICLPHGLQRRWVCAGRERSETTLMLLLLGRAQELVLIFLCQPQSRTLPTGPQVQTPVELPSDSNGFFRRFFRRFPAPPVWFVGAA